MYSFPFDVLFEEGKKFSKRGKAQILFSLVVGSNVGVLGAGTF